MSEAVTMETATVYRGGGRRYFTRRAAWRAAARQEILRVWEDRWGCSCGDVADYATGYVPEPCETHGNRERLARATDRLVAVWTRTARRRTPTPAATEPSPPPSGSQDPAGSPKEA